MNIIHYVFQFFSVLNVLQSNKRKNLFFLLVQEHTYTSGEKKLKKEYKLQTKTDSNNLFNSETERIYRYLFIYLFMVFLQQNTRRLKDGKHGAYVQ